MRTGFFYAARIGGELRLLHSNAKGRCCFEIYRQGIEYDNIIFVYSDKLLDRGTPTLFKPNPPGIGNRGPGWTKPGYRAREEKVAENLALHYMFARVRARVIENANSR